MILRTDAKRVYQILQILLNNASKFTPSQGSFGIEGKCEPAQRRVTLTVWDTGIGIDKKDFPRLFKPFVQLDAALARQYEGGGLGLALAKGLAQMLGGDITVESTLGKGSQFTLILPLRK